MGFSTHYKDTPVIPTTERLPNPSDGSTVLAREHQRAKWWRTRWSAVTRVKHAEWRKLEFTEAYKQQMNGYNQRSTEKRKASKKK